MVKAKAKKSTTKKSILKATKKNFHNYEIENAKSIKDCEEIATVDCYDEYEQAAGWHACLEDVFDDQSEVLFMGEVVKFKQFACQRETTVAVVVNKKGKSAKVSLESIEWIKPSRLQLLWHEAYVDFLKCC